MWSPLSVCWPSSCTPSSTSRTSPSMAGSGLSRTKSGSTTRDALRGVGALPMILSLIFVVVLGFAIIYGTWWLLIRIAKAVRLVPHTASPIAPLSDFAAFATVYGLLGGMLFGVVFITNVVPDGWRYVKDGGIIESDDFFSPYSAEAAKLRWIGSAGPGLSAKPWARETSSVLGHFTRRIRALRR